MVGHQPPPIFRRGPAPLVRLFVLVCICLGMLIADLQYRYLDVVRKTVSVVLYPLEMAAAAPVEFLANASRYFSTLVEVQGENRSLRKKALADADRLLRQAELERENARLRELLEMSNRAPVRSIAADVLYEARDAFSRKVILDRGAQHDVQPGQAVVDELGVVGQVTRVYPIQAEVTLVTDKGQAVPVRIERTGQRGVIYGAGDGRLELRYLLANADVQPGDLLVTSGLDDLFLPGIPVAKVVTVDRTRQAFALIACEPVARVGQTSQVLILGRAVPNQPPATEADAGTTPGAAAPAAKE
ncbi:rod shape-determining protein MreC [Nitrogeniibacter mangrovi]|uniref:Cell shape-determining protein MreC n=1 Tax=Nitrogeniibacter mangrovi TaxID=2016596 RepID=A0A6C1AYD8_9RHOO|nr:rod shape-determining protein MreC [Nitrogeniibacter mangrovi]QID16366.1 rod shape-determining protein MreC [Nitrogeniibacter mangrovi]